MDLKAKIKDRWPELAILIFAAVARLFLLGMKPPHFDEGVNGWFVDQITHTGFYHYDPTNYHGPLHFYILFLMQTLLGRHVWALRLPLALTSLAMVWFTIKFDRFIGRGAALWAAAAMAVSPACVFYGRYAIHEYWLVMALMLIAWGLAGLWKDGSKKYFWAIWSGITIAVLIKETYALHFVCAVLAIIVAWFYGLISPAEETPLPEVKQSNRRAFNLGIAAASAFVVPFSLVLVAGKMLATHGKLPKGLVIHGFTVLDILAGLKLALPVTAFVICMGAAWMHQRREGKGNSTSIAKQEWTWRDMLIGFAVFVACVIFFYSGGFMDFPGLKGLYEAFAAWAATGKSGNGHEKVWYYWIELLAQYEWPSLIGLFLATVLVLDRIPRIYRAAILVAGVVVLSWYDLLPFREIPDFYRAHPHETIGTLIGLVITFLALAITVMERPTRFIRAIAIYGGGALIAYTVIPYKTPWCIISLTWPFIFLFGYAMDGAVRKWGPPAAVAGCVLIAGNAAKMIWLNYFHFTDADEPYVYVQTFPEISQLMEPLRILVARDPTNYQLTGHIMMESYHPLPWLLGDFPNVGYWGKDESPPSMDADFIMVDDDRVDDVEAKLHDSYFTSEWKLRDAMDNSKLYLSAKVFATIFRGQQPDFVPKPAEQKSPTATPQPTP